MRITFNRDLLLRKDATMDETIGEAFTRLAKSTIFQIHEDPDPPQSIVVSVDIDWKG